MIDWAKRLAADLAAGLNAWIGRHRSGRVSRRAVLGFLEHDALQNAGSMAYFSVLSVFQVLLLGVVVLSLFVGTGDAREFIVEQVHVGTPIDARTVETVLDAVIRSRGGITIIGFVLLVWSALGAFSALQRGIAGAFIAAERRPFLRDKLVGLTLMGITGVLGGASIAIGIGTDIVLGWTPEAIPVGATVVRLVGFFVPLALIFDAFLAVYRIAPNRPVSVAEVWPGAVVATLLWTVLRIGFTFYATSVANYDSAFGPISTSISLLVFLYFASVIVLLGAEVARANVLETEAEQDGHRVVQKSSTV